MAIIRGEHRENFTAISNDIFNSGLSPEAIGILCYLLSKPPHWRVIKQEIRIKFDLGREKLDRIINEIVSANYMIKTQSRNEDGSYGEIDIIVYGSPMTENPLSAETFTANQPLVNNKDKKVMNNRVRFTPPTVEEVAAYCQERANGISPNDFVNHYEANGWMRGKNKIKDWRACVRTWEKNSKPTVDRGRLAI